MTGLLLFQALYFALGGAVAWATARGHAARMGFFGAGFDPVSAFLLIVGTVLLWPVLIPLDGGEQDR